MKTAVVVNPHARAFRLQEKLASAVRLSSGGRARVWLTQHESELDAAAEEMRLWGAERVVLCGGDGTLMSGVTALVRAFVNTPLPQLVVAPAGTVATVPRNWGQRAGLLDTVARACGAERPRRQCLWPTLRVVYDDQTRIGFIFGTGLVARFFEKYYAAGGDGYRRAARIAARTFVGSFVADRYSRSILEPLRCTITVDGHPLPAARYSLVVSSVVRDLGLHMWVTHRAGEDPRRPHLVASTLNPRRLGPQAPRVLMGRPLRGAGGFDDLCTGFVVQFPEGPGPWVLDGDIFFASEIGVQAGPQLHVAAF